MGKKNLISLHALLPCLVEDGAMEFTGSARRSLSARWSSCLLTTSRFTSPSLRLPDHARVVVMMTSPHHVTCPFPWQRQLHALSSWRRVTSAGGVFPLCFCQWRWLLLAQHHTHRKWPEKLAHFVYTLTASSNKPIFKWYSLSKSGEWH